MEFYLDSANLNEIKEASELGFITGLTTTPTFMHRDGIKDIDGTILQLSKLMPVIQVEALGNNADEIEKEADRLVALGLDPKKTVFKIPISLEGAKACKRLVSKGYLVNLHLVYTLQQAYVALSAGASYVCPLAGRLQDQGHDALSLFEQCVDAVDRYGYDSKIMFSSVRHPEHIRNALNIGVHTCTMPWKVIKMLPNNNFTTLGTNQFVEHTRLMTVTVGQAMRKADATILQDRLVKDALIEMTKSKLGAITVVGENEDIQCVFTDGDLRRMLENEGEKVLNKQLLEMPSKLSVSIEADALLYDASELIKRKKVDNIVVTQNGKPIGMLDVQDLIA
ncbi:MAG: transaldolase [Bacteroidetes bacterium MED-G17]|nr:MAG: transaldolase [Bacteroidetes bacterium MED-G17]